MYTLISVQNIIKFIGGIFLCDFNPKERKSNIKKLYNVKFTLYYFYVHILLIQPRNTLINLKEE
jgi:hypothetical protein